MKILVVDDHADTAEACAALLRVDGHEVRIALSGHGALAEDANFNADLVLLDILMPGMNGIKTARHFRRRRGKSVRLIACTSLARDWLDRGELIPIGFDAVLAKPFCMAALTKLMLETDSANE